MGNRNQSDGPFLRELVLERDKIENWDSYLVGAENLPQGVAGGTTQ